MSSMKFLCYTIVPPLFMTCYKLFKQLMELLTCECYRAYHIEEPWNRSLGIQNFMDI